MLASTKILYIMHGTSIDGEQRHHVGITSLGRYAERRKEHRKARDEPFDIWARQNTAVVEYEIIKYNPERMEERVCNLLYDLSTICPICQRFKQPIPF